MVAKSGIIKVMTAMHGEVSLDAKDILAVNKNKHGMAIVIVKSRPGMEYDTKESYDSLLAKWEAAIV